MQELSVKFIPYLEANCEASACKPRWRAMVLKKSHKRELEMQANFLYT